MFNFVTMLREIQLTSCFAVDFLKVLLFVIGYDSTSRVMNDVSASHHAVDFLKV